MSANHVGGFDRIEMTFMSVKIVRNDWTSAWFYFERITIESELRAKQRNPAGTTLPATIKLAGIAAPLGRFSNLALTA